MPQIEVLSLEMTDVTEAGFKSISTLPKLRLLSLHHRGFDAKGLAHLKGMTSLEELRLMNTSVTNEGLSVLADLPNLKKLSISTEERMSTLTDAGLVHLRGLSSLEKLELSGGWASKNAIAKLQSELPHCKIVADR